MCVHLRLRFPTGCDDSAGHVRVLRWRRLQLRGDYLVPIPGSHRVHLQHDVASLVWWFVTCRVVFISFLHCTLCMIIVGDAAPLCGTIQKQEYSNSHCDPNDTFRMQATCLCTFQSTAFQGCDGWKWNKARYPWSASVTSFAAPDLFGWHVYDLEFTDQL